MQNRPLMLGVTGGIGAGKTIVCNIFTVLGIPVYNADTRAKVLMELDRDVIDSIKKYIGEESYLPGGLLNREYLAHHVFKDGEMLETLNGIVHPAVAKDFHNWSKIHGRHTYIVKEAALLIESGSAKILDYIVNVVAPVELRIERTLIRDAHRTREQVKDIMSNQLSDAERAAKSKFIITNDDQSLLIPQVLKIHDFLINSVHAG